MEKRSYLVSPQWDFWLLGGISVLIGLIFGIANLFRENSPITNGYFLRLPATFGLLSLVCNYPHFIISYKIGYGRGLKFIAANWFQLIVVPFGLLILFLFSFQLYDFSTPTNYLTAKVNPVLLALGSDFYFGSKNSLGQELLLSGLWLMYLTVGWHYSKQVFGCLVVYLKYLNYPLSSPQKKILKYNLLSVALFNFVYINTYWKREFPDFFGGPGGNNGVLFELAPVFLFLASILLVCSTLGVIYFILIKNKIHQRVWPGATPIAIWCSFYIWWVPVLHLPEFYIMAVPFFHSLQYLPFAYRMEQSEFAQGKISIYKNIFNLLVLFVAGILAFDLIPEFLDGWTSSSSRGLAGFFAVGAVVFINIHHFFIDNVSWRSKDRQVQRAFSNFER